MKGRARLIGAFCVLLVAGACSSTETKAPRVETKPGTAPRPLAARPWITLFDKLERDFMPSGFEPGRELVVAPIHSGLHATLYYFASRGLIPSHLHRNHEETVFLFSGTGTLELQNGKSLPLHGGNLVRIPPGICHGYTADPRDPLKGIVIVSPTIQADDAELTATDLPGTLATAQVLDPTSTKALDALPATPDSVVAKRVLDASKDSTVSVAAVRRDRIPEHIHKDHDETVIIFAQAGYGFLRLDEAVHIVEVGSIVHIPAGTVHSFEHKAEGHIRAVTIHTSAYDGSDQVAVEQTEVAKPPEGYKVTDEHGDFVDPGAHRDGDFLAPRRDKVVVGPHGEGR